MAVAKDVLDAALSAVRNSLLVLFIMFTVYGVLVVEHYENTDCYIGKFEGTNARLDLTTTCLFIALGIGAFWFAFAKNVKTNEPDLASNVNTAVRSFFKLQFKPAMFVDLAALLGSFALGLTVVYTLLFGALTGTCQSTADPALNGEVEFSTQFAATVLAINVIASLSESGIWVLNVQNDKKVVIFRTYNVAIALRIAFQLTMAALIVQLYNDYSDSEFRNDLLNTNKSTTLCTNALNANNGELRRHVHNFRHFSFHDTDGNRNTNVMIIAATTIGLLITEVFARAIHASDKRFFTGPVTMIIALLTVFSGVLIGVLGYIMQRSNSIAACPSLNYNNGRVDNIYYLYITTVAVHFVHHMYEVFHMRWRDAMANSGTPLGEEG